MTFLSALLYTAFFLSGLAGLIYETIWGRYLALLVGHGAYAQVVVLAVFLGGLSAGALWVGRRSERIRRPLMAYAGAELLIGLFGFFFHDLFLALLGVAEGSLFPLVGSGMALTVLRWSLAVLLLAGPSFLLGTTFPLITSGLMRMRRDRPGRLLSHFYFLNSLGASLGALLAGFVLIGALGLQGTSVSAAGLNLVAALLALTVARGIEFRTAGAAPSEATEYTSTQDETAVAPSTPGMTEHAGKILLGVAFGTAVASFIYEIAWIRMLSLVLGSATHSFELMLSAFILGLAIGALIIREKADRLPDPMRSLAWIQWAMGTAALLTLPLYLGSFRVTETLLAALQATDGGYALFNLSRYGMALAVMLPATILAGMTLPLITMMLVRGPLGERSVGWVYGVNTLGSIVGASLAALVLMPLLGLKLLLVVGAGLDMLLGVYLLRKTAGRSDATAEAEASWPGLGRRARLRRSSGGLIFGGARIGTGPALVGSILLVAGVVLASPFELTVLGSGVFRTGRADGAQEVVFWKDGRTASVGILDYSDSRILATNGKPDASLSLRWLTADEGTGRQPMQFDESTQALLPLITLAHASTARTALVIGQGSGMSSHFLLASPLVEELVTAEIEPEMIEGSRAFYPFNRRVFDDPRSGFVLTDARALMAADRTEWDLILSEPSNPWVSGVSNLFTSEFYAQVADRLAPGGAFGQWLHLYEMTDDLLLTVFSAMYQSFGDFRVFRVGAGDILVVATAGDRLPDPDWSVAELPLIRQDLALTYPLLPDYLSRTGFLSRAALAPLLEEWDEVNSDFHPLLDLRSEKTRFQGFTAAGLAELSQVQFSPSDLFEAARPSMAVATTNPMPEIPALQAIELAARLDSDAAPAAGDRLWSDFRNARFSEASLGAIIEADSPPSDWRSWLDLVSEVEAARAGGRTGWVDEEFWTWVHAYADRWQAPAGVKAALRFRRALRARDWAGAAQEVRVLSSPQSRASVWVDPGFLRDAGVAVLLAVGQVPEARFLEEQLAPFVSRADTDLRSRLLESYLSRAERGFSLEIPGN